MLDELYVDDAVDIIREMDDEDEEEEERREDETDLRDAGAMTELSDEDAEIDDDGDAMFDDLDDFDVEDLPDIEDISLDDDM